MSDKMSEVIITSRVNLLHKTLTCEFKTKT